MPLIFNVSLPDKDQRFAINLFLKTLIRPPSDCFSSVKILKFVLNFSVRINFLSLKGLTSFFLLDMRSKQLAWCVCHGTRLTMPGPPAPWGGHTPLLQAPLSSLPWDGPSEQDPGTGMLTHLRNEPWDTDIPWQVASLVNSTGEEDRGKARGCGSHSGNERD